MEITKFIPHRGTMILIDEIIDDSKDNFSIEVKITKNSLLYSDKGVPSYAGIEYMAQSIAAFNSIHFKNKELAKIGFIIAIRNYKSKDIFFQLGQVLIIKVSPLLIINNSGSFNCTIEENDNVLASGKITAYVPTIGELDMLKKETI